MVLKPAVVLACNDVSFREVVYFSRIWRKFAASAHYVVDFQFCRIHIIRCMYLMSHNLFEFKIKIESIAITMIIIQLVLVIVSKNLNFRFAFLRTINLPIKMSRRDGVKRRRYLFGVKVPVLQS